jgi:hypothetical protein
MPVKVAPGGRAMKKKSANAKGKTSAKDLRVRKRSGESVKGGRITNIRANVSGLPAGGAGTPGQIIAI